LFTSGALIPVAAAVKIFDAKGGWLPAVFAGHFFSLKQMQVHPLLS
jgi:hypothetical protein